LRFKTSFIGLLALQFITGMAWGQIGTQASRIDSLLKFNRGIQSARASYHSAEAESRANGVLPDPMLELTSSISPVQTRNGPIDHQIMLAQKFPLWGKLKRQRAIAEIKRDIAFQTYQNIVVTTVYQSEEIWANYQKLEQSLAILATYSDELESFRKVALTHYSTGQGDTQHPILKLQIEQSLIQSKTNALQSQLDGALHGLQALFDGHLAMPDSTSRDVELPNPGFSEADWLNLANRINPMLQIKRSMEQMALIMTELNQKQNYPDLTAGLSYSIVGPTKLGGAVESGKDAVGVKVGLNMPIWVKRNQARVQAAEINQTASAASTAATWNQIKSTIQSQLQDLVEIEETCALYEDRLIPETKQMVGSAYSAYQTGKISFLDLLDSQRMSFNVRMEYENVKASRKIAAAKLYRAVGLVGANGELPNEN